MPETGATADLSAVPLPPGAVVTEGSGWADWNNECRIVRTAQHDITKNVFVEAVAVQLPDGTFEHDDGDGGEAPSVTVQCDYSINLSVEQARALAGAITEAADSVEAWMRWAVQR